MNLEIEEADYMATLASNIAPVCHEVNRAYCRALGDGSQPHWSDLDEETQRSAIKGVAEALGAPDITPEGMHEHWCAWKRAHGWTYGEHKNAEKKEHPCLLPWRELPREERVKDYLFLAVVRALS